MLVCYCCLFWALRENFLNENANSIDRHSVFGIKHTIERFPIEQITVVSVRQNRNQRVILGIGKWIGTHPVCRRPRIDMDRHVALVETFRAKANRS